MSKTFYLPRITAQQIEKQLATCQNLGLILDKYPETQVPGNSQEKSPWLREILQDKHIDGKLAQSAYNRWLSMAQAIGATFFRGITDWRMVVGLGGETVLETDLTLHHLYGIPFIPGSALKGLTRSYITTEVEGYQSSKVEEDNETIKRIFGSQERAGTVIFFDALPVNGETTIELDIMNPHYPDYYGKGQAPTNDQNPRPINFLTVANTAFMFALAPRRTEKQQDKEDVEHVKKWLQDALKNYGIGGKTSAGYGYFKEVQDEIVLPQITQQVQQPVNPELQKASGYVREVTSMPNKDVASQIQAYYQRWQQLQSDDARQILATAIVEKVKQAGREKASIDKKWYIELLEFLGHANK